MRFVLLGPGNFRGAILNFRWVSVRTSFTKHLEHPRGAETLLLLTCKFQLTSHHSHASSQTKENMLTNQSLVKPKFGSISISQSIVRSNFKSWIYKSMTTKHIAIAPPKTTTTS